MKNKYEIRGEVTAIFLNRRDGSILETLIDTDDLNKLSDFPGKWCAVWRKNTNSFYVQGPVKSSSGKVRFVYLHRFITNPLGDLCVDHINHNTLDNRRSCNLRVVTQSDNSLNPKNKPTGTGGATWHKKDQKWQARITLNGKRKHLGNFDLLEDAIKKVNQYRRKSLDYTL